MDQKLLSESNQQLDLQLETLSKNITQLKQKYKQLKNLSAEQKNTLTYQLLQFGSSVESLITKSEELLTLLNKQKQWRLTEEEKDNIDVEYQTTQLMKTFLPFMIRYQFNKKPKIDLEN